jgi:DHA2 family methylenomycin A resistance protein-like MFS transporter
MSANLRTKEPLERPAAGILTTVATVSFGFAMVQLDVTVVNVALPAIGHGLGAGAAGLQWIVDAYTLAFAALMLNAGFLGDRLGARRIYLAGMAVFAAGSLACGAAPSAGWLIAARALQGVGAAAMLPNSLTVLNHATAHDPKLRAKAVGWWTAAGAITIALGPIVGGVLLSLGGWRSIFLVNLPVCAVGALLMLKVEETEPQPASGLDLPGQVLAALALAGLIGAVIEAHPLGVASPIVWGAAAVGAAAAALFVLVERRARRPMLPLDLFAGPGFSAALLYGVLANLTYYGALFVLSLYLQTVLGYPPLQAGLAYLPLTATFFGVNLISGWWVGRAGSRAPMVVGGLIDGGGFVLLTLLTAHSPYWAMAPAFLLLPCGMGLGVPAMTTAVLASTDKARSGLASGVLNAARQAGGALGVAAFGALAAGDSGRIVLGLHASSAAAAAMLLIAAIVAALGVKSAPKTRDA